VSEYRESRTQVLKLAFVWLYYCLILCNTYVSYLLYVILNSSYLCMLNQVDLNGSTAHKNPDEDRYRLSNIVYSHSV
jgi:hypothetical protein